MDQVYIKATDLLEWERLKFWNDKDLITVADLLEKIEDLDAEKEELKKELEDLKQDIEDNYKRIPVSQQVGISDSDFL